ncbi:MAG: ABC transporter permease [Bacillaceae bacterium]
MNKFLAAFKFYFLEGFKAKSYLITLAIMCIGVIALSSLGNVDSTSKDDIAFVNTSAYQIDVKALEKKLETVNIKTHKQEDVADLRKDIENRKIDGIFVVTEKDGKPVIEESYNTFPNRDMRMALSEVLQGQYMQKVMKEGNVSPEVLSKLLSTIEIKEDVVKDASKTFGMVYIFVILMYMFILMFGQNIGTSIASEKSSRVTEVMLSKIPPMPLLYAKITSLLALAFIQIGALVAAFFVSRGLGLIESNQLELFGSMLIDLNSLTPFILLMFVLYFLLGYLIYATMYAAAGSLVSRVEDLQTAIMPIVMVVIVAFGIGMFSMTNPTHIVVKIGSYIPFFSPIVTFSRIIAGEAGALEITITLVLLLATIMILNKFVSRIYLNGIMNYSEKFSWKRAISFAKKH